MLSSARGAEASLNDLLETALKDGPQIVTRNGVETAVIVSIHEWERISGGANSKSDVPRKSLKDILLDPNGPHDIYIPPRRQLRFRTSVEFE